MDKDSRSLRCQLGPKRSPFGQLVKVRSWRRADRLPRLLGAGDVRDFGDIVYVYYVVLKVRTHAP